MRPTDPSEEPKFFHLGLVATLGEQGFGCGYAVEASNTAGNQYTPERGTGLFGAVEAIGEHAGWKAI